MGGFSLTAGTGFSGPNAGTGGGAGGGFWSLCAQATPTPIRVSARVIMIRPLLISIPLRPFSSINSSYPNLGDNEGVSWLEYYILLRSAALDRIFIVKW